MRSCLILALAAGLLAACQIGGLGGKSGPSPLAVEDIEVTPLRAPDAPAEPAPAQAVPAAPPPAKPAPPEAKAKGAAKPEESAAAPPPSPEVLACTRRGGIPAQRPGGLTSCQSPTRDAGKACRRKTDCDGQCLARSGTCAPAKPLFGCNDILDSTGRKSTLCIE